MRRSRHRIQRTVDHGRIADTVPIRERPADFEDRTVPRQWEGDLPLGSGSSQIATLVERSMRYTILVEVERNDANTVVGTLNEHARQLPNQPYESLTWDSGNELEDHRRPSPGTDIQAYFFELQSRWQRRLNENPMFCGGSTSRQTSTCPALCIPSWSKWPAA